MKALLSLFTALILSSSLSAQDCDTPESCYQLALEQPVGSQKSYFQKAWDLAVASSEVEDHNKVNILVGLASCNANEGNIDKALEQLEQCKTIYAPHVDIYLYTYQINLKGKKDTVQALNELQQALDAEVESTVYLYQQLGAHYSTVGNLEESLTWYTKAQDGVPYKLYQGSGENATFTIHSSDTRVPGNVRADIHYQKANLIRKLNPNQDYVTDLNLAIFEDPNHALARYWRGSYYYRNKADAKAKQDFLVFLKDYPQNVYAMTCVGDIAYGEQNWVEAANYYLDAYKLDKADYKALYYGTRALWQYAYTNQSEWSKYYDTIVSNMKAVAGSGSQQAEYARQDLRSLGVAGY